MSVRRLLDLTGRVALVTGGSRGLGLQMAEALGEMGARVALTARKRDELDQACAHLESLGIEALPLVCDMADAAAIAPMVERAAAGLGAIDILVNNAGTTWGADMLDHPLEAWKKVVDLNLTAMFVTTQEVGRRCMVPRRRGRIINIASVLGMVGGGDPGRPGTIGYNTSKGGVISFTRSLAAEWAQHDINVNAIAPGFFPTKMTKGLMEMMGERVASKAPLNRVGGPEDLKGITVVLASDAGAFITGQTIAVDGGYTAV
jgi:gluconate 5-dehydrogenase